MNILEKGLFPESQEHPILFEDIFIKNSCQGHFFDEK